MNRQVLIPFVAARGGLGRTLAILQVARQLAEWGKRILVVDLDFPSPAVGLFREQPADVVGTADYLANYARFRSVGSPRGKLDVAQLIVHSHPYDLLPAGRPSAISYVLGREKQMTRAYGELRSEIFSLGYDFVLVDMPSGNLSLSPPGLRGFIVDAVVTCGFTYGGPEHVRYMQQVQQVQRAAENRPILWVVALTPPDEEEPAERWLRRHAEYTSTLPRISALEFPMGLAWQDPKYLTNYRLLAESLADLAEVRLEREPVSIVLYDMAVSALKTTPALEPTVLGSRLRAFLNPRVMVMAGRHGAGKTALVNAYPQYRSAKVVPVELVLQERQRQPEMSWEELWVSFWSRTPKDEMLHDGPDEAFEKVIGWSETIEAVRGMMKAALFMRENLGENWMAKILLLPGTIHATELQMKPRQVRSIQWTKPELLEMALQRAVQVAPEFGQELGVRHGVRLSIRDALRHENWTRGDLESVASILFGPRGLAVWNDTLPDPYQSELVPGEAAEFLALAMSIARDRGERSGFFVPPATLAEALRSYSGQRVYELINRIPDRQRASQLLAHPERLAALNPADPMMVGMLNWGLVSWVSEEDRTPVVPPLVLAGLTATSAD